MMDEQERRSDDRSECDIAAKIELSDGLVIACIVKDLSGTGVKVEISETVHLPDEFDLLLPVLDGVDQRYRVKTIWRNADMLGGGFTSPMHLQ